MIGLRGKVASRSDYCMLFRFHLSGERIIGQMRGEVEGEREHTQDPKTRNGAIRIQP
jgi:hypothetical protein